MWLLEKLLALLARLMPDLIRLKPRPGFFKRSLGGTVTPSSGLGTSIIVPEAFGPGPDFSDGVSAIPGVADFIGTLLPTIGSYNAAGMQAAAEQIDNLRLVSDPTNPYSGQALEIVQPGHLDSPHWPRTWCPPDFGGRASSRWRWFDLLAAGLDWQELNIRRRYYVSGNWTQQVRACSETLVAEFVCTSSTTTSLTRNSGSFTPDAYNPTLNGGTQYWARPASNPFKAYRIVGNTATTLQLDPAYPGSYAAFGSDRGTWRIFTAHANGSLSYNAGTKMTFPRLVVDLGPVSGTVHGQAYSFPAAANVAAENNFLKLTEGAGSAPDAYVFGFALQINDWDGVTTDGQGAIGTNGQISFGLQQRRTSYGTSKVTTIPFGSVLDLQVILKMNTPGQDNGRIMFKRVGDASPLYETLTANILPKWVPAVVNVGGVNYTVARPVVAARWAYIQEDPTLGGGLGIPENDMAIRLQAQCVRGKNIPVSQPVPKPNPQLLPLAQSGAGSLAPNMATVAALQLATPAGGTYTDPYTGVTVLKLTGPGTPTAGSHEHGYAEGNARISQSWIGPDGQRYSTIVTGDAWVHDVRHSDMVVTRRVQISGGFSGEMGACFSMNPATPRIIYLVRNGNRVDRFDTETMQLANTTGWPWQPTRPGGASGNLEWLHTSVNDTWMSFQWGGGSATALGARRMPDGLERSWVVSMDEHHLDKSKPYIYGVERPTRVWNLETDTKFQASDPGNHIATDHSGTVRGALVGTGFWEGGGGAYYYQPDTNQVVWFITSATGFHSASNDWYNQGLWTIDQPSEELGLQWFTVDRFLSDDSGAKIRRGMLAFTRLDGEVRLIACHASTGSNYNWYPQVNTAIDGRLVMWTSDMNGSGQYQVFVAKVPTA